jgi:hypothetical protein
MNHRPVTVSLSIEEYELLQSLHSRLRKLDVPANNSTPIRAGVRVIAEMDDAKLEQVVRALPVVARRGGVG